MEESILRHGRKVALSNCIKTFPCLGCVRRVALRLETLGRRFRIRIDTTTVKNIGGSDCCGRNPTDRGRRGTKISVIVDKNKVAVSEPTAFPANVHDSKTVEETLKRIPMKLHVDGRIVTRLIADKAYISNKLFEDLAKQKTRLVTEPKKGAKKPTNSYRNEGYRR